MITQTKTVLGFASEYDAAQAGALIGETPGYEDFPLVVCHEGGRWFLECYDGGALNGETAVRLLGAAGLTLSSCDARRIPQVDWVSETQKALPPVRASRFTRSTAAMTGSSRRGAIEIDAGRAFGTAHHGTTKGCLLALSRLGDLTRPRAVLDLGTGSGVLAIAAAKAFAHKGTIAAVDLDPIAIEVARDDCRKNGAGAVQLFAGDGVKPAAAFTWRPRYRRGEYSGEAAAAARAAPAHTHAAGRHPRAFRVAVRSGAGSAGALPLDGLLPDPAARS